MEIYGRVRRAVRVEGRSQRAVAKEFGLSRETVRKMLQYAVPPGYQRQQPIKRPKLGPWLGVIDAILADDKQRPAKQRHTAKRIFDRLRDEHGFTGGYAIVKDYVNAGGLRTYYEAQGSGDALVMLHGGFASVNTFGGFTPRIAERFRVFSPGNRTPYHQVTCSGCHRGNWRSHAPLIADVRTFRADPRDHQ